MPSQSASQQRLMRAAAHTPGGFGGVSQNVGKDFVSADKKMGGNNLQPKRPPQQRAPVTQRFCKGGKVLSTRTF